MESLPNPEEHSPPGVIIRRIAPQCSGEGLVHFERHAVPAQQSRTIDDKRTIESEEEVCHLVFAPQYFE
jgi:hypothetical protein